MEPQLFELIAFGLLAIISGLVYRAKYKQYRLRPFPELRRRVLPSFLIGTASLFLFFLAWSDISGNLSWGVLILLFVTMAIMALVSPAVRIRWGFYKPTTWLLPGSILIGVLYGFSLLGANPELTSGQLFHLVNEIGIWLILWGLIMLATGKAEVKKLTAMRT
jgi:hypothetical protein